MNNQENFMNWNDPGIALITGASSGIGAAYARSLSAQGFDIILIARRKERLETLAKEIEQNTNSKATVLVADLSKLEEIENIVEKIRGLDKLDVLINNAGFGTRGYFEKLPLDAINDMLFVHNFAPVHFSRAALPGMIKQNRGVVINVSSMAAFTIRPQGVMYCSTKVFLKKFSEVLQTELHDTNVKVQALCPGYTRTEIFKGKYFKNLDFQSVLESSIPEEFWLSADEVVDLSLNAVPSENVVFIPGEANQKYIELYLDPILGKQYKQDIINGWKIPRK
jgi:short-subunit dehydrogenase